MFFLVCSQGKCICPSGFSGDPKQGCHPESCSNDLDCLPQEICLAVTFGARKCVDGCTRIQCGPNALCVTQNHRSTCICQGKIMNIFLIITNLN